MKAANSFRFPTTAYRSIKLSPGHTCSAIRIVQPPTTDPDHWLPAAHVIMKTTPTSTGSYRYQPARRADHELGGPSRPCWF